MPVMIAAVVIVGGLCLLDLLLTFGVIRRLREHTTMISGAAGKPRLASGLSAGDVPAAFSAITTDTEIVSGAARLRVVAFFASWCSVCPERVQPFAEYLGAHDIRRDNVLVVSVGPGSTLPSYLTELSLLAQICIEQEDGEIARAFKVTGFPAFFLLDSDGSVALSEFSPSALPEPATV
jgi:hypothetical protein